MAVIVDLYSLDGSGNRSTGPLLGKDVLKYMGQATRRGAKGLLHLECIPTKHACVCVSVYE